MITFRSSCCDQLELNIKKKNNPLCVLTLEEHQNFKCVPFTAVPIVDRFSDVTKLCF